MKEHLQPSNRLIHEASPYLLQHAYNPVSWYPWGDEAFAKAKAEDKPIFLSIGYSTCHWCHVMAHESFEDHDIAALLNRDYISVKVDREERPDVDTVYMSVCQAMTGGGGWPLTIIMTPQRLPFYAGTYLPKTQKWGQLGLDQLLTRVAARWRQDREELIKTAGDVAAVVGRTPALKMGKHEPQSLMNKAFEGMFRSFDPEWGGFGRAPKFPMPHMLLFLLEYAELTGEKRPLHMAEHTLQAMMRGGIFDHVGGGLSRYSTDSKWLVPHFEKMLYDNALLILALTRCGRATGNQIYGDWARQTITYIRAEMTSPEGGFYSAQDADSQGEEGKYYVWSPEEVISLLGPEDGQWLCAQYDITPQGNFEGKSIPNLIANPTALADSRRARPLLRKLYRHRAGRMALHKDDKHLTAWNSLMIAALAGAYLDLGQPEDLTAAMAGARFIEAHLTHGERLRISYREGRAVGDGLLEDYAFYAWACLTLYDATLEACWLQRAGQLMQQVLSLFADKDGGFFMTPADGQSLIFRPKEVYDGALISGNSVAGLCLFRLAALTGAAIWLDGWEKQSRFLAAAVQSHPQSSAFALLAMMEPLRPGRELVCVLEQEDQRTQLTDFLRQLDIARLSVLVKTPDSAPVLDRLAPFTAHYTLPEGREAAYYLCQNHSCQSPVYDLESLKRLLTGGQ